jgi:hypothetical protein
MADSVVLGALRVLLSADDSELKASLSQSASSLDTWSSEASSKLSAFGASTTALGGTLTAGLTAPIAGVVGGLLALATQSASTGEEIYNNATAAGVGVEAYQELQYALDQVSKLSEGQVTKALQNLTLTIGDAAQGSDKANEALSALGFTQDEIASGAISTEQAFNKFSAAMQNAETPAAAMALAGDLVGTKIGKDLALALRESGGEIDGLRERAHELGIVMTEEGVKSGEKYKDSVEELKKQFGSLGNEISTALLPVLTGSLIPFIQGTVIPAMRSFAGIVANVIEWFGKLPGPVQTAIGVVVGLAAALGPLLIVVGSVISALSAIMPVVAVVGGVLAALATGPVLIVGAALVGLAAIWVIWGDTIKRNTSEAIAFVKIWLVDHFNEAVGQVQAALEMMQSAWTTAKDFVIGVATAIYEGVKNFLVDQFAAIISAVSNSLTALQTAWTSAKDVIVAIATAIYTGIYEWLVNQFTFILDAVTSILSLMQTAWTTAKEAIIVIATALYTGVKDWLLDKLSGLVSLIQSALTNLKAAWETAKTAVIAVAQAIYEGVKSWLVDKFTAIVNGIKDKIEAVTGFFKDMKDKIVGNSYVPDMVSAIAKEFGKLDNNMVKPSQNSTRATEAAFEAMSGKVPRQVQEMFSKMGDAATNFLGGSGGGVWGSIVSGGMSAVFGQGGILASLASKGLEALSDLIWRGLTSIAGFFKRIFGGPSAQELAGREIVDAFEDNITSMLSEQQRIEAGGEEWKQVVIGVRDKYIEMGRDGGQALIDVKRLWDASRQGPEAVQAVIEEIKRNMSTMPSEVNTAFSAFPDEITIPINFDIAPIPDQQVEVNVNVNMPDIPDIPSLAVGGIVTRPTLAMIGESGPEAVVPLSRAGIGGGDAVARRLESLIDRLEHILPIAIRDAMQMA